MPIVVGYDSSPGTVLRANYAMGRMLGQQRIGQRQFENIQDQRAMQGRERLLAQGDRRLDLTEQEHLDRRDAAGVAAGTSGFTKRQEDDRAILLDELDQAMRDPRNNAEDKEKLREQYQDELRAIRPLPGAGPKPLSPEEQDKQNTFVRPGGIKMQYDPAKGTSDVDPGYKFEQERRTDIMDRRDEYYKDLRTDTEMTAEAAAKKADARFPMPAAGGGAAGGAAAPGQPVGAAQPAPPAAGAPAAQPAPAAGQFRNERVPGDDAILGDLVPDAPAAQEIFEDGAGGFIMDQPSEGEFRRMGDHDLSGLSGKKQRRAKHLAWKEGRGELTEEEGFQLRDVREEADRLAAERQSQRSARRTPRTAEDKKRAADEKRILTEIDKPRATGDRNLRGLNAKEQARVRNLEKKQSQVGKLPNELGGYQLRDLYAKSDQKKALAKQATGQIAEANRAIDKLLAGGKLMVNMSPAEIAQVQFYQKMLQEATAALRDVGVSL